MTRSNRAALWRGFSAFFLYAPGQLSWIFLLQLVQGLSAGVGLLMLIPLLQLVGIDMGGQPTQVTDLTFRAFQVVGVDIRLESVLIAYVVLISVLATVRYQLSVLSAKVQHGYTAALRLQLFSGLLHSRWAFITQSRMSDFTHCLSGQVQSVSHAMHLMLTSSSQFILMLVMVALAISLSWKMCLLALVFVGCLMGLLLPLNRKIYRSGQSQLLSYKTVFAMLTEQLSSLKVVKSYVREDFYCQQLNILSERLEAQHVSIARVNALTRWIYWVGAAISFSVFFYVALSWLTVPLPTLLLLLFIFSRLLPQASQLQTHYQQLLHKVPAFADIEQMKGECAAHAEHSIERTSIPPFQDVLELRAVSYQYAGKSEPVFSDMDLRIEKNKTLAIMGPSGAGKSTLADLIAGLVAPTEGGLYCDGLLINDSHRIGWRKNIAYVTQDVYLFNDSLRANLSWVAEEPLSDEDIWQALKLAAADDFVSQLPQQLDTFIGDRGIRLSGGERQRLALARAILSKPKILILDEATSALDHANEQKIQQALAGLKGKLTIIIVAHRETTVAHADDIIHLPFEKADNPRLAVGLS